jgi:hypothetical protein
MPFTASHVAAVLPFHRPLSRLHVFTAAVIGSMVPDFSLFVRNDMARWQTHSVQALFTFCLPVGLISWWLTQVLIKPAMIEVLPNRVHARLLSESVVVSLWSIRYWVLIALALVLGAATHIAWDNLTHENSRGMHMFPVLTDFGPEMGGHPLRLYRWLQYASSAIGLIAVLLALLVWWLHTRSPQSPPVRRLAAPERALWFSAYFLLPLGDVLFHAIYQWPSTVAELSTALREAAIGGMRWTLVGVLLISALLRLRLAVHRAA